MYGQWMAWRRSLGEATAVGFADRGGRWGVYWAASGWERLVASKGTANSRVTMAGACRGTSVTHRHATRPG